MARGLTLAIIAAAALGLGLVGPAAATSQADATAPVIAPSISGKPGSAGWYVGDTTVTWSVKDAESSISSTSGCGTARVTSDTRGRTFKCTAKNAAGLSANRSVTIRLDETAPRVTATAARRPDYDGWYNRPFTVSYTGRDGASGVVSCDGPSSHAGPDGTGFVATGGCTNGAGLKGVGAYQFRYDATPTSRVSALRAQTGDHRVSLTWSEPPERDYQQYVVTRTGPLRANVLVYQGPNAFFVDPRVTNGVRLRYDVTVIDRAGNRSSAATLTATANARLLAQPRDGARVSAPPLLRWAPYRHPRYYLVELWRGGGKVLAVRTTRARLQLKKTWVFNGRSYRLKDASYRWVVFPGIGFLPERRYGPSLGSSRFVVRS